MTATSALPRWDMTSIFPGPDSPEFVAVRDATLAAVDGLAALFDEHGVGSRPAADDDAVVRAAEEIIAGYNEVSDAVRRLFAYLVCLVDADTSDTAAQAEFATIRALDPRLDQLAARLTAWLGTVDVERLVGRSPFLADHAFALRDLHRAAAHLMGPEQETLAAELGATGGRAWAKLRDDVESSLTAELEVDGDVRTLGIGELQALASHPDRDLRARAHAAELGAWERASVPLAAALNGIKGETVALARRRGWDDPIEPMLVANRIDRATLDALSEAIQDALPLYRRLLRAKARALGLPVLAAYDLYAPVGSETRGWPWDEAVAFVTEQLGAYDPALGALAERAIRERWIDAEPRPGKTAGGFCAAQADGTSRILLNYAPTYDWMSGLAHELGHAYHAAVQHARGRTWLQRPWPPAMTLAETASTFCEVLVQRAARRELGPADEPAILDGWLGSVGGNVFGSFGGFALERRLLEDRRRRELSVDELNGMSLEIQRERFGDAVEADTLQPTIWAAIPHLYSTELWYYNFPYAFGMLFGLGLFARYEADPTGFRAGFDDLLADTGMADAADLAARFGIDIRESAFWRSGLDLVRADVDRFEAVAA